MKRLAEAALCAGLSMMLPGCYSGLSEDGQLGLSGGGLDGDGDGDGDGDDDDDDDDAAPQDYEPAPVSLRLLLGHQYQASVRDLLGTAAADAASPPDDTALNGFTSIGAAQLALGDAAIDAYEDSARAVALVAMEDPGNANLAGCTPSGAADAACFEQFVIRFGRLAFRRPLEADEVEQWVAVGTTAGTDAADFDAGMEAIISGMLQSPFFLYQVEIGEQDPDNPDVRRLTAYEMATRMSFFMLGTTPDEALLDAAEAGELDGASGVEAMALDLLARPEAAEAVATFFGEVFRLRELSTLPKDAATFPQWDSTLATSMERETSAFVEHIWQQGGDFRELYDANYTFVDDVLAAHYGIPGDFGPDFVQVELPADQKRGGILGHAGMLALLGHVTTTSPTLRGKFIRESVLCQVIPPPPPEVVTDLPPSEGGTLRERLEIHMTEPSCAACHQLMDPIGFGLESYDSVGAFRTLDNGFPIDDSADIDGMPFAGAQQLGAIIKDMPSTSTCLLRNLYRHGTGHLETADEFDAIKEVDDAFAENGYRLQDALAKMVASPAFRFVGVAQ